MSGPALAPRLDAWVRWALAGFCVACALAMLPWPMYWDHGVFVLVAQSLREGHPPYVAAYDVKGPLTYVPYALALALPVSPAVAIRVADIVALACTAVALEYALRPSLGALTTRLVTTLVVVGYVASGSIMTAQPDGWCALLLTAAAALGVRWFARAPLKAGFVYGLAVGACCWVKPTFAVYVFPPLVAAYWIAGPARAHLGRTLIGMATGIALISGAVLAWLGLAGGLRAFVEVQWGYNRTVYAVADSFSYGHRVGEFIHELLRGSRYYLLPVLIPGVVSFLVDTSIPRGVRAFATALVGAGCVNLVVQGKFLPYQWLPVTVPLSAMATIGFAHAAASAYADRGPALTARALIVGGLGLALVALALEPAREIGRSLTLASARGSQDAYLDTKFYINTYNALGDARVARYLAARLAPSEPLGLWGLAATVPVLANRSVVSRFVHSDLLGLGKGPLIDAYRAEYMTAFNRARPRYVIYPASGPPAAAPQDAKREQFPALWAELDRAYVVDTVLPGYVVLRRMNGL